MEVAPLSLSGHSRSDQPTPKAHTHNAKLHTETATLPLPKNIYMHRTHPGHWILSQLSLNKMHSIMWAGHTVYRSWNKETNDHTHTLTPMGNLRSTININIHVFALWEEVPGWRTDMIRICNPDWKDPVFEPRASAVKQQIIFAVPLGQDTTLCCPIKSFFH